MLHGIMGGFLSCIYTIDFLSSNSVVSLPLDPILLMISELLPKIQELQASTNQANATPAIIDFLRSASIQDALPDIPSPPTRRFMVSLSPVPT